MKHRIAIFFAIAVAVAIAPAIMLAQGSSPLRQPGGLLNRPGGLLNRPGGNMRPGGIRPGMGSRGAAAAAQQAEEANAAAEEAIKNAPKGTNGVPALVFDKAPLELVLKAYADIVQKTVIPAPDLPKAEITLKSLEGQVLEKEEYLEAIEVILAMNGVVLEPRGEKFLRALQRKTVRTQGIPILMQNKGNLPEQGRVVSQMITLQNIEAAEAQKALEGFKDPSGLFQVFERTNAILVTDTQENINRMLEVVRVIDIASPVQEDVFTVQIKYALAADIRKALETIVTESQKDLTKPASVTTKTSGTPGFTRAAPPTPAGRLLNLNNRPGVNQPQQSVTPNETLLASVSDADRGMIRGKVLILDDERSNKLIIITSKANMKFFDKVIETLDVETTPDVQIKVFRLKYAECEDVASMLNDLIGNASSSSQNKGNPNTAAAKTAAGSRNLTTGATAQRPRTPTSTGPLNTSKVGELSKDNCKVLADKRINGVVVYARTQDMATLKRIIDDMDIKLSQVLIEMAIIEVSLEDGLTTGIDWVQRGRVRRTTQEKVYNSMGQQMFYKKRTITNADGSSSTKILSEMVPSGYSNKSVSKSTEDTSAVNTILEEASDVPVLRTVTSIVRDNTFFNNGGTDANGNPNSGYMLGGGGGSTALSSLFSDSSSSSGSSGSSSSSGSSGSDAASSAANAAAAVATSATPFGSGINYILKSDKLNLAAIINASKNDRHTKYIASPVIMTVDNKEAQIEATESRKFYSGSTSSGSYGYNNTSYNYSDKDIGIKMKVTPKINPDGTVMLTIEEEYSQLGGGQTVFVSSDGGGAKQEPIDTSVQRKMSADILLDNMQTVILGGLTSTYTDESEVGIPILKDIPWIGKWLFSKTEQSESRKELLVFMTPYVLDDADAAQAEAMRRKKSISDPRPWEDHGWSASELADPVSKQEKLRRFKDEWARQDEERKTKLAIEKAKMDRAKKLEKMDEEERKFWLELHRDELEKEEKEAFERQMEEQKDLHDLAASIRAKKMAETEKRLKAEDKATKGETERELMKKEKEAKEENAATGGPGSVPASAPAPAQAAPVESPDGRAGAPRPPQHQNEERVN